MFAWSSSDRERCFASGEPCSTSRTSRGVAAFAAAPLASGEGVGDLLGSATPGAGGAAPASLSSKKLLLFSNEQVLGSSSPFAPPWAFLRSSSFVSAALALAQPLPPKLARSQESHRSSSSKSPWKLTTDDVVNGVCGMLPTVAQSLRVAFSAYALATSSCIAHRRSAQISAHAAAAVRRVPNIASIISSRTPSEMRCSSSGSGSNMSVARV